MLYALPIIHIVRFKTIVLSIDMFLLTFMQAVDVGNVFKDAVVRRVDATVGMLLELPTNENPAAGYVHVSISSEHFRFLR
jgi:hypothetical protein